MTSFESQGPDAPHTGASTVNDRAPKRPLHAEEALADLFESTEPSASISHLGSEEGAAASDRSAAGAGTELREPASHRRAQAAARGLRMFNSLRPLLPVVGTALGLVNHGAAQAAARLLPLLGGELPGMRNHDAPKAEEERPAADNALKSLEKRHIALAEQVQKFHLRSAEVDEKLRQLRETIERAVSEQMTIEHRQEELQGKIRTLTAGLVTLTLIVMAQIGLAVFFLHR